MIKLFMAVTFLVSTLSHAECFWLTDNGWEKINTQNVACIWQSGHYYPDRQYVEVSIGPGFKTLAFLKAGVVTETAVLSN